MITDNSTIADLAAELAALRGRLRIITRRSGFSVAVEWPNGNAILTNVSLGAALDGAVNLLRAYAPEPIEPVAPDPEGARVGPAPTGTRAGYRVEAHCASCGFGEEPGQVYSLGAACPSCSSSEPCSQANNHEGNHTVAA